MLPHSSAGDQRTGEPASEPSGLVGTLDKVVLSHALDGTISDWNADAERLYGYRAEEIVGKPVTVLVPPERAGEVEGLVACLRRGEAVEQFETVRRRKDGSDVPVSLDIALVKNPAGEVAGATVVLHDLRERKRREETQRLLAEASRLLAVDLDYRETLPRVAELIVGSIADWCIFETADAEGSFIQVAVSHRDPAKVELARQLRHLYPPAASRPNIPLRVSTTGRAELVPEVSDALLQNIAQDDDHLRMLRRLEAGSLIVAPLRTRDRVLGTVLLANDRAGWRFGPADLAMAEDLGSRAALAIDNAALHRSEQNARQEAEHTAERIGRLQAVTEALSGAVTTRAVAGVLVGQGTAAVGADGGFVRLLSPDGRTLELEATMGYVKQFEESYRSLPLTSPLPGAESFRTGSELYFGSAAAAAASPEFARMHSVIDHEAMAFVPLLGQHGPIGAMALSFVEPRTFGEDDREFLRTLAAQSAQAIERARLYEAEQLARMAAELANEQTRRLQLLAAELAGALTPLQVAEVVVAQGIASVDADAGALQLLIEDGELLEVVSGAGSDPTLIEGGWSRFPVELQVASAEALRNLEPVFVESMAEVASHGRAGAHIPLVVSGKSLGVLFLGFTTPRPLSRSQRSFLLALGRQCAQALKRAQLYESELEERSKLSRLVERLREGVISVDRDGRVAFASSNARRLLGAALEQGRPLPQTWHGFPLGTFAAGLFATGESVVETQVVSEDGKRVFDVTGIPGGRSDSVLVVVTDVSEREQVRRAEREFVDNAAHELRTPLAAITSSIERLQAGAREIPEKRDRFLGYIQHESARLNRLASSLLVLARAQTREEAPRREQIELRELLEEIASGFVPSPEVELVLDCRPGLVVLSNRDLLEHALGNLVSNAARHTEAGRIRVGVEVADDGSLTIEVADTGAGIAPDALGRLFDRFYRGATEKERSGVGLGLPITKDSVEALGGRVEIDSILGEGTTARIVLPDAADTVPA